MLSLPILPRPTVIHVPTINSNSSRRQSFKCPLRNSTALSLRPKRYSSVQIPKFLNSDSTLFNAPQLIKNATDVLSNYDTPVYAIKKGKDATKPPPIISKTINTNKIMNKFREEKNVALSSVDTGRVPSNQFANNPIDNRYNDDDDDETDNDYNGNNGFANPNELNHDCNVNNNSYSCLSLKCNTKIHRLSNVGMNANKNSADFSCLLGFKKLNNSFTGFSGFNSTNNNNAHINDNNSNDDNNCDTPNNGINSISVNKTSFNNSALNVTDRNGDVKPSNNLSSYFSKSNSSLLVCSNKNLGIPKQPVEEPNRLCQFLKLLSTCDSKIFEKDIENIQHCVETALFVDKADVDPNLGFEVELCRKNWPEVQCLYQIVTLFIEDRDRFPFNFVSISFVKKFVRLLNTPDFMERKMVESIILKIYNNFEFVRNEIIVSLLKLAFECTNDYCIDSLLIIMNGRIFHEFKMIKMLILPLFLRKYIFKYFDNLKAVMYSIFNFNDNRYGVVETVEYLLKHWPLTNSSKQGTFMIFIVHSLRDFKPNNLSDRTKKIVNQRLFECVKSFNMKVSSEVINSISKKETIESLTNGLDPITSRQEMTQNLQFVVENMWYEPSVDGAKAALKVISEISSLDNNNNNNNNIKPNENLKKDNREKDDVENTEKMWNTIREMAENQKTM